MDEESLIITARRNLAIQYAARLSPRSPKFQWPSPPSLLLAVQAHLEDDLFLSNEGLVPAPNEYQRVFLKTLIDRLSDALAQASDLGDDSELEVDERLFCRYTALLSSASSPSLGLRAGPPPPSTIQYLYSRPTSRLPIDEGEGEHGRQSILHDLNSILLHEAGTMISRGTTGLRTWEASLALASHILASFQSSPSPSSEQDQKFSLWHSIVRPGARVLELGSGVGMLGVLCAQLQSDFHLAQQEGSRDPTLEPAQVYMTDVPGDVLLALSDTVERNNLSTSGHVHVAPLDWVELSKSSREEEVSDMKGQRIPAPDASELQIWLKSVAPTTILATDVAFDPFLCGPLAKTVRFALEAGDARKLQEVRQGSRKEGGEQAVTAYIAIPVRNPETYAIFLQALRTAHLSFERIIELSAERVRIPPLPDSPSVSANPPSAPPLLLEGIPIFPSAHEPLRDGVVELLQIRLLPSSHRQPTEP
ncbi:hypothetical protein A4X09_0g4152 [Tilletia walkeri]|uniref:Uncharacterized protein n=1 Tax=Tilletia walkeri TaxID=117179 RepID=A0A8X7N8B5_9BASI|nr:hypothetical protein A4X09_0g4152 [Tilletia walkeri]